ELEKGEEPVEELIDGADVLAVPLGDELRGGIRVAVANEYLAPELPGVGKRRVVPDPRVVHEPIKLGVGPQVEPARREPAQHLLRKGHRPGEVANASVDVDLEAPEIVVAHPGDPVARRVLEEALQRRADVVLPVPLAVIGGAGAVRGNAVETVVAKWLAR